MRSQLKRVDGEVSALSQRIKDLDENLVKSEQYIKSSTAALAEAVAMEVERQKNAGEDEDDVSPLSQFDAQLVLLEGKLMEAKYLAAKANGSSPSVISTTRSSTSPASSTSPTSISESNSPTSSNAAAAPQPPTQLVPKVAPKKKSPTNSKVRNNNIREDVIKLQEESVVTEIVPPRRTVPTKRTELRRPFAVVEQKQKN